MDLSLKKLLPARQAGDVAGFAPQFDETRGLWFADLVINTYRETYAPFVRLALVRYPKPHALPQAKISRVALADFAQLTPDRVATVTSDPFHPHKIRVVVSGVAPTGPKPAVRAFPRPHDLSPRPTRFAYRPATRRLDEIRFAWSAAAPSAATVAIVQNKGQRLSQPTLSYSLQKSLSRSPLPPVSCGC